MGRRRYKDPSEVRHDTLAVRVNREEREMVKSLALRLQRTQSDAVRLLIREAARGLELALGKAAGYD